MNIPSVIIDCRAPKEAIRELEKECNVHLFYTQNITYQAISCHPDVFMCKTLDSLIVAPNIPKETLDFLQLHDISFEFGNTVIDESLQNSSAYNCICLPQGILHKQGYTDSMILKTTELPVISLPQSYTRCSVCMVTDTSGLCSDKGIINVLHTKGYEMLECNPAKIQLPPYPYGFIGGCFGVYNSIVYCIGNLDYIDGGDDIRRFIANKGFELHELYDGPLYDGGGIFIF